MTGQTLMKIYQSKRIRVALTLGIVFLYLLLFFPGYLLMGTDVSLFGIIPVFFLGGLWGLRWGLAIGLLCLPLNLTLFGLAQIAGFSEFLAGTAPLKHWILLAVMGGLCGWVSELQRRVWEETAIRQQLEEDAALSLRSSEERWKDLMANSPDFIVMCDREGTILFANRSNLGQSVEDLVGTTIFDYLPPDEHEATRKRLERVFTQQEAETHDMAIIEQNGDTLYYRNRVWPVYHDDMVIAVGNIAADITDRLKAEHELIASKERAEEMSRLKSHFLANMSHEIRTPMNGIIGFASILESQLVDPKLRAYANRIFRSGNRLLHTINEILDLSKMQSGKQELTLEPLDIVREAHSNVSLLEPLAVEKGLEIKVHSHHAKIEAYLDSNALSKILNNLVGNAIKFTQEGSIKIELDREDEAHRSWVFVRIADTGIGISPDFLPHIFDEFKQESSGYDRNFEGNGLGLTIARQLVELMNGSISVESVKNKHTIFTIQFPAARLAPQPTYSKVLSQDTAEGLPSALFSASNEKPRVLLVEDDPDNQELTRLYLTGMCHLDVAFSGDKALEFAKQRLYDAVLLDINLGIGMDGIEIAQHLRQLPSYARTPLIAFTAYTMKGDRERFVQAGFDDHLSKPYTRDDLRDLIEKMVH